MDETVHSRVSEVEAPLERFILGNQCLSSYFIHGGKVALCLGTPGSGAPPVQVPGFAPVSPRLCTSSNRSAILVHGIDPWHSGR